MDFAKILCLRVMALFAYHDDPRHFLLTENPPNGSEKTIAMNTYIYVKC